MIISRTPFRISFFGGGTDFPAWFRQNGGAVLSTTFDKYCYITCRDFSPFFDYKHRIVYSTEECVQNIDQIRHPAVRETFRFMNVETGLSIHHDADLPARSGIGSSSAFTAGLLNVLNALSGKMTSKKKLADDAIAVEQHWIKECVGSQDQIAAVYGGLNHIVFKPDESIDVTPIILSREFEEFFQDHLCLYFTGFSRYSSEIEKDKIANMPRNESILHEIQDSVDEGIKCLCESADIKRFGELLSENWLRKRSLSNKVSTDAIDAIYQEAMDCGAYGGKLLGAGGGGFMLFVVPPNLKAAMNQRLNKLMHIPFSFEKAGSQIVLYQPAGF